MATYDHDTLECLSTNNSKYSRAHTVNVDDSLLKAIKSWIISGVISSVFYTCIKFITRPFLTVGLIVASLFLVLF